MVDVFVAQFPYARLLSIIHMPGAPEVKLTLLDRDRPRAVYLIFGTTSEAIHFLEDVEHMRLVTRKIIELHERRRREAEARQSGENSMGGPGGQPRGAGTTASALGRSVVNDETPTSPGLRSLAGLGLSPFLNTGVHDGSQSPQLSQLGSPRSGALF